MALKQIRLDVKSLLHQREQESIVFLKLVTCQREIHKKGLLVLRRSLKDMVYRALLSDTNYTIGYTKDGKCYYKRIMKNYPATSENQLLYDDQLCNDLSSLFKKFSKELNKCNQIISEMSNTVEKFKTELGSPKLQLTRITAVSTDRFQEAIAAASECAKLTGAESTTLRATKAQAPKKNGEIGARR